MAAYRNNGENQPNGVISAMKMSKISKKKAAKISNRSGGEAIGENRRNEVKQSA
jgi:hypothetical protein